MFLSVTSLLKTCGRLQIGRRLYSNDSWIKFLEAHEKEYFIAKRIQYLEYVKTEMEKGRTIEDLISEVQHDCGHHPLGTAALKEEDCYITKNVEFITYAANELKKGKLLSDLIAETKERIDSTTK